MEIGVILDRRSVNKQGKHPVKFRFYNSGKAVHIATNLFAFLGEFDELNLFSLAKKETREHHRRNNIYLINEIDRANKLYDDLRRKGQSNISAERFKELFIKANNEQSGTISFDNHFQSFIDEKTERTKNIYQTTYNKLKSIFGKEIYFDDVDFSFLQKFESELIKRGNSVNTISIDMRNIRAVFNDAAKKKLVSRDLYPFYDYKIKNEETEYRAIPVDKLKKLFAYSGTDSENWARDVAKLMFYLIGINATDLYNLEKPIDGRINYRRDKTGRLYSIKLEPETVGLIEQFKGQNHFLRFQEQFKTKADFLKKINGETIIDKNGQKKYLKRGLNTIGDTIGVDDLTSYVLRHTWATIAGELEIPKETISKALGHGKKEVTDIYIKFDYKKVDDANRKVIDYVFPTQKDFKVIKTFINNGIYKEHVYINKTQSDYKIVKNIGIEFAHLGKEVKATPVVHFKSPEYQTIYKSLIGTKYYRKCPDLLIDDKFYEVENYLPPFSKDKINGMFTKGLKQSQNIIINNTKGASDRYVKKIIHQRIKIGQNIDEVWLYEKGKIRILYKKQ